METVIRRRPVTSVDRYGNDAPTSWLDQALTVSALAPTGPDGEQAEPGRQAIVAGYTLYADEGVDLDARDRIVARGTTWEVDGEVGQWTSMFGTPGGVVAVLKRVRG